MAIPVVAIVGRPNVGKSSLFNVLVGIRTSIVEATPGVTRDRVTAVCDVDDNFFELVDTGGYGIVDRDDLGEHVERQIRFAVQQAQLILFVVDGREDINPLDRATAELLRTHTDRVCLLANKIDAEHLEPLTAEYVKLGYGEPIPVSAVTGHGRTKLNELIESRIGDLSDEYPEEPVIKIAIVAEEPAADIDRRGGCVEQFDPVAHHAAGRIAGA